jgi:biopolymer transport protein ExbD
VTNISPSDGLTLPVASTSDEVTETLKIEISPDTILLDDKSVTTLENFKFEPSDLESDRTSRSLNLSLIVEKQKRADEHPKLMLLADQKTPYSTVKRVMDSASNQGFSEFKLVVVEEQ